MSLIVISKLESLILNQSLPHHLFHSQNLLVKTRLYLIIYILHIHYRAHLHVGLSLLHLPMILHLGVSRLRVLLILVHPAHLALILPHHSLVPHSLSLTNYLQKAFLHCLQKTIHSLPNYWTAPKKQTIFPIQWKVTYFQPDSFFPILSIIPATL